MDSALHWVLQMSVRRAATAAAFGTFLVSIASAAISAEIDANAAPPDGGPLVIRRLSPDQYRNIISQIFGPTIKAGGRFEPDVRVDALLAVGAGHVSVTASGLEAYDLMARDIASQVVSTVDLLTNTGCGASTFAPGYILFQVMGDDRLRRFSTSSFSTFDTVMIHRTLYGMAVDEVNYLLYAGETDYSTYGKIFIYNTAGSAIDSFDVSVSPGNIALDIRSTIGIQEFGPVIPSLSCFPNPSQDQTRIVINGNKNQQEDVFELSDLSGRILKKIFTDQSSFLVDMHTCDAGLYILRSTLNAGEQVKIIKQ